MNDWRCLYVLVISLYVSTVLLESTGNGKGCYYKGSFHHGNWTDGCEFNCTCLDSEKGHYKCHTRCPVSPQLPAGCVFKPPSGEECCKQPDCSLITSHYNNNISSSNGTNGDNDETSENTKIFGNASNDSPTDNEEEKGCFYKGKYHHGNWTDGCEFNCSCEDPVQGLYRCKKRCREYTELDPGCILEQRSTDDCCKVLACNSAEASKYLDNKISEIKTSIKQITLTTLPPTLAHFVEITSVQPTSVDNAKSVSYKTVSDSNKSKNSYTEVITAKETEKLAIIFSRFGPIRLFTVSKNTDKKSQTPNERNNKETITLATVENGQQTMIQDSKIAFNHRNSGQPQNSTDTDSTPPENTETGRGVCPYKGRNFTQGEQWYVGCDFICVCENSTTGFYRCRSRCQKNKVLPSGCVLRRSQADSCCLVPDCGAAGVNSFNQKLASPRILQNIEDLEKTPTSILKRMFNQRIQRRNKFSQTEKDKMVTIDGKYEVPFFITASRLDKRKPNSQNNSDQSNKYSDEISSTIPKQIYIKDLQKEISSLENLLPNTGVGISNRTSGGQEIVTPFSVNQLDLSTDNENSAADAEKVESESKGSRNETYRTIATETGIFRVRKRDGVISTYGKPMMGVLKRKDGVSVSGKNTPGFCNYKNKRFNEEETWFDGCELVCICQSNGQYSCHNRCPEYSRIPAGCSVVAPRVGQCCSTLICRRIPTRNNPLASYLNL